MFAAAQTKAVSLEARLGELIVGQDDAIKAIAPVIRMYQAGLSLDRHPVGTFLLLGPTGTGKTRTVEAVAKLMHGSARNVLRIDCGEFQYGHEVAKLIGAPPGYLGHRETQPRLTQSKLNQVMSAPANLAIVLFDEVEKAHPDLWNLLLGILDNSELTLGDGTKVNFDRSMIFMTSNVGAAQMAKLSRSRMGFEAGNKVVAFSQLESTALNAAKKKFPPEFLNRVDNIITYQPLGAEVLDKILEIMLEDIGDHLRRRLGDRMFYIELPKRARKFLLEKGVSTEYGARELRRTLRNYVLQPLADMLVAGEIPPDAVIEIAYRAGADKLTFKRKEQK